MAGRADAGSAAPRSKVETVLVGLLGPERPEGYCTHLRAGAGERVHPVRRHARPYQDCLRIMMHTATLRRSPLLPVLALLALAVGLTLTLVPHGRELALLRLAAGDSRGAVETLQQLVASGDRSPATLSALARALARAGDVTAAAQVLERLAEERPGDRAVLEALAGLQRDAGRTNGLIQTLQSLQAIAPQV